MRTLPFIFLLSLSFFFSSAQKKIAELDYYQIDTISVINDTILANIFYYKSEVLRKEYSFKMVRDTIKIRRSKLLPESFKMKVPTNRITETIYEKFYDEHGKQVSKEEYEISKSIFGPCARETGTSYFFIGTKAKTKR